MRCRRCGFEMADADRCELCDHAVDLGVPRDHRSGDGFPLVIHCVEGPCEGLLRLEELARSTARSGSGRESRRYFLFDLEEPGAFFAAVPVLHETEDWGLILDGRDRPYARELWLPLLALFEGDPQQVNRGP